MPFLETIGSASAQAYGMESTNPTGATFSIGSVITFTPGFTAGSTTNSYGQYGPTRTQAFNGLTYPAELSNYVSNTSYFNVIQQGYQQFVIPTTGTYRILCTGARGGNNTIASWQGGYGALVGANFALTAGTQLIIAVGQTPSGFGYTAGGGGASWVSIGTAWNSLSSLLLVGGGGGGAGDSGGTGRNASSTNDGTSGTQGYAGGTGGNSAPSNNNGWGQGGASWNQNGSGLSSSNWGDGCVALSYYSGLNGACPSSSFNGTNQANSCVGAPGGFGGGGSGACNGGGGGGGYSGGASGGGGGGLYIAGTGSSQTINTTGSFSSGSVTITRIS